MFEDKDALVYYESKLERCKAEHEMMKAVNEYYRKNGTVIGCPAVSKEKAAELDEDIRRRYPIHTQPYMPSALRNKLAEIHRIQKTIDYDIKGVDRIKNSERGR
jgi:hypothetical protein